MFKPKTIRAMKSKSTAPEEQKKNGELEHITKSGLPPQFSGLTRK
jgi:hypothetical protein